MSYRNYDYFLKIVQYNSISKAAEILFISQPSLSKYLQRLEASVGASLVDRTKTPLKLTYAGEIFYEYIIKMGTEERKLETMIHEINNLGRDKITIGVPLWRSTVLLPEFLPYFYKKHPLIEIKLIEGSAQLIEGAILKDEVDIGLINLPVNYADISYEPIIDEHILLVGSRKNMIVKEILSQETSGKYHTIDIETLVNEPFIMMQPDQHITKFVNQMLSERNLKLHCRFRTANVTNAINLAAVDLGFTFVPELGTKSKRFPHDDAALFYANTPPLCCALIAAYKKNSYLSQASKILISELQVFCNGFL